MLLNDKSIRTLCDPGWVNPDDVGGRLRMIEPFSEAVSGNGVISYGLSHAGYDLRLGPEVLVFKNSYSETVDPKAFGDHSYRRRTFDRLFYHNGFSLPDARAEPYTVMDGSIVQIPAHGYILGQSYEYLRIPRHLKGRCVGKSTLARSGILINTTPLEPGWEGHLTIEIGNITPCSAKVYVMEGIAQLEFELLTALPETDYGGKKYQGQTGVTPARVL